MSLIIRSATLADAWAVASIYNHYVRHTLVTFEEEPVSTKVMEQRISAVRSHSLPWLVAENRDEVVGFAHAAQFKDRSAYRFCVETSVYLVHGRQGHGIGTRLYSELLEALRQQHIHTAIGIIALPNPASVTLHEKLGFRHTGTLAGVGFKQDQWIDVGYWQKLL
jgi:L-amino acid N-acyltransferase YncA